MDAIGFDDLDSSAQMVKFAHTNRFDSMKRLITSLSLTMAMWAVSLPAFCQITITRTSAKSQVIAVDPLNQCGVATGENGFFLFSSTSNMFDDAFIMYLGADKDGAKRTLESLIDLIDVVKNQNITFQDGAGTSYTASTIYKGLKLTSSDYAGDVYVAGSLLSWLQGQLDNPDGGPWDSITDAANDIGSPEKVGNIVAGGQLQKWGSAYCLAANNAKIYLGNSKEDALATMKEYEAFASSKEQVWPVIIINARVSAQVTNASEIGAKTAYVKPSDGCPTIPLYQLYMKKYVKILEK